MTRKIIATIVAASLFAVAASPASAHYYRGHRGYYGPRYDAGSVIALNMFNVFAGIAASQTHAPYGYGYVPPAPYSYYPNSSYDPSSFGPRGCAPGFYWTGDQCWPY